MAKKKGPTREQIGRAHSHPDARQVERREYTIASETAEGNVQNVASNIVWMIVCPFCSETVKAYLWSLSGGGKRCTCGAMLDAFGNAHHWEDR